MPAAAARSRAPRASETLLTRRASFVPSTANPETRTVRATISTGAGVTRRDARGDFIECLDLDAIVPATLVGLPVLDSHDQTRLENLVGVVDRAGRDGAGLWADIRISERAGVWGDIVAGIIRGCSLGYAVTGWRESTVSGRRTRTAVAWRVREISLVAVPADAGATLRSRPMPNENENDVDTIMRPVAEPTVTETRAAIRGIARAAGLPSSWADEQIDAEATRPEAEAAAFREMQERSRRTPRIRTAAPQEDPTIQRRAMEDVLVLRMGVALPNDDARQEALRPFAGATLRDLARVCVNRAGLRADSMNPDELFRAAVHSTSDFPALLTGAGQRTLLASYAAAASPLKTLARQGTRPDFRTGSAIRVGEIARLERVGEGGEIKHTSRAEAVESYALDTFAAMFTLSRKAGINDDLGGFADWSRAAGHAAASTEADLLGSLLSQANGAGPVMGDGKRLFHADHGNLLTGADLSVDSLSAARLALRLMKGLDGKTPIAAEPFALLVPPALESEAEKVLVSISAPTTADANPFSQRLRLFVDPRISGWYMFANPAQVPVLEYSYLASVPGPQVSQRDGWDVLAREFRVFLDFGCGALDWRGAVRNPGV